MDQDGSRCCTRTKPRPVSLGRCSRNWVKASRPPAEAPMPAIAEGALIAVFGADTFSPALFPAVFAFFPELLTGVLLPLTPIPFPCDSACSPRQIGYR